MNRYGNPIHLQHCSQRSRLLRGWILSHIYRAIERLDTDIRNMPSRYVRRDDYRDDMGEIKVLLGKISDKLDHKVDKP